MFVVLMAVLALFLGKLVSVAEYGFNHLTMTTVDTSQAPKKLIVRGIGRKEILREDMRFVCVRESFASSNGRRRSSMRKSFKVLLETSNNQLKVVSRDYFIAGLAAYSQAGAAEVAVQHAEAAKEAKRIAAAYDLPIGVCN